MFWSGIFLCWRRGIIALVGTRPRFIIVIYIVIAIIKLAMAIRLIAAIDVGREVDHILLRPERFAFGRSGAIRPDHNAALANRPLLLFVVFPRL